MTWWVNNKAEGLIELRDDDRVIARFTTQEDADEVLDLHRLCDRQAQLLSGVVNAIRGAPGDNKLWSHHDAPELAGRVMSELSRIAIFLQLMRDTVPIYVDTSKLLLEKLVAMRAELAK